MSLAATMQAACIDRVGGPIRIAALPVPRPGPTDVLVRVAASGVNHVDLFVRSGAYRTHTPLPFVIGRDAVGSVVEVGAGVAAFAVGDRVWCNSLGHAGRQGALAEYAVVAADRLYRLPDAIDFETGALRLISQVASGGGNPPVSKSTRSAEKLRWATPATGGAARVRRNTTLRRSPDNLAAPGMHVPFMLHSAWMPRAVASPGHDHHRFADELARVDELPADLAAQARNNTISNFRLVFEPKFMSTIIGRMDANEAIFKRILDDDDFLEVHGLYAQNVICGFGRVEGRSIGVVANQPMVFAGCLDIKASEKAARFVRTCDAFNIPVLTFVDVPGFLPGTDQEWDGIIRRGAKLIYAYAEATVPLLTVITRKAYGGAYCVMGSKPLGADVNLAWPTAQIAVMGAEGAVNILYRRELASAEDAATKRAELITDYNDTLANPYVAAERGYVDKVIYPHETRAQVIRVLRLLRTKRQQLPPKKHGNIPL